LGEVTMRMRWTWGVALVAGMLGQAGTAVAQQFMPPPNGAAPIPEPIPCGDSTPNLVPGPISPLAAPQGPPDCLSLPGNHSNAFPCEKCPPQEFCYFSIGAQGLVRQKPGQGGIAVLDAQNLDTGIAPPTGRPLVQQFNDINQNVNFGPRFTVGYLFDDSKSIEFTGFYIFDNYNSIQTDKPGRIDVFFNNAPLGFEGDNGLWLQADRLRTQFNSRIASGELNYRYTDKAVTDVEVLLGVRYVDQREALNIYTGDDDLTVRDVNGNPDPVRSATYFVGCNNRMICPQLGLEYSKCVGPFAFGITAKGAWGVNLIDVETKLNRNDGLVGFDTHRNTSNFGQIYDIGAYVDFSILERLRLRAGYNAMWLTGVATAVDNLDFNLSNPSGRQSNHGSIFYQGPTMELQFLF
jgi:Putative beta barrel porin-7 (BBP7)